MTTEDFVTTINKLRLANKQKWFWWDGIVNGQSVRIKCYETYLQIFKVNEMTVPTVMEMNVGQFKEALRQGVN